MGIVRLQLCKLCRPEQHAPAFSSEERTHGAEIIEKLYCTKNTQIKKCLSFKLNLLKGRVLNLTVPAICSQILKVKIFLGVINNSILSGLKVGIVPGTVCI
jgi:hypothetical protein